MYLDFSKIFLVDVCLHVFVFLLASFGVGWWRYFRVGGKFRSFVRFLFGFLICLVCFCLYARALCIMILLYFFAWILTLCFRMQSSVLLGSHFGFSECFRCPSRYKSEVDAGLL